VGGVFAIINGLSVGRVFCGGWWAGTSAGHASKRSRACCSPPGPCDIQPPPSHPLRPKPWPQHSKMVREEHPWAAALELPPALLWICHQELAINDVMECSGTEFSMWHPTVQQHLPDVVTAGVLQFAGERVSVDSDGSLTLLLLFGMSSAACSVPSRPALGLASQPT
jgi:hypothetical protein